MLTTDARARSFLGRGLLNLAVTEPHSVKAVEGHVLRRQLDINPWSLPHKLLVTTDDPPGRVSALLGRLASGFPPRHPAVHACSTHHGGVDMGTQ